MDIFPVRCSLWDIHIFQITGSDDVIFMNNLWHFDVFGGIFISLEPFIAWSCPTPDFNQKTQLMRDIYIEVHHFKNWKYLKITILDPLT